MISVIENARERSQYSNMLTDLALKSGLDAVGVSSAEPFTDVRIELERRRSAGLHAEMQFTFRNPERSTTPTRILEGAKSLIVGALRTNSPNLPEAGPGKMKIGAYARCDYYSILRSALNVVAEQLLEDGWKSRVVADDNSLVDRAAAVRAGIGWYGKNGNVLIPGRGSWFVLGSVVTNAPLSVDTPISKTFIDFSHNGISD